MVWRKERKLKAELSKVELKLKKLFSQKNFICFLEAKIHRLKELECKKDHLLEAKEVAWSLNSRPIWLREADKNTSFFHKYASYG